MSKKHIVSHNYLPAVGLSIRIAQGIIRGAVGECQMMPMTRSSDSRLSIKLAPSSSLLSLSIHLDSLHLSAPTICSFPQERTKSDDPPNTGLKSARAQAIHPDPTNRNVTPPRAIHHYPPRFDLPTTTQHAQTTYTPAKCR